MPGSGTVYRIGTVDGPNTCRNGGVQFSWNAVGPQGSPGLSGLNQVYTDEVTVNPGERRTGEAICPSGQYAISGGWWLSSWETDHDPHAVITSSFGIPAVSTSPPVAWGVRMLNFGTGWFTFRSFAVCAVVGS